ncbi:MAG: hypothetical protein LBQ88_08735 [Treponema sp.]|jgi:hypothetical protein|nr:hypothetical protein [Treponema sp.]
MAVKLNEEVIGALNNRENIKVLATVDKQGLPHAAFKENIFFDNDKIILLELIETSQTNSNMVHSIWFNKPVSISVKDGKNNSWHIRGLPKKTHIAGPVYEKYYVQEAEKNPEIDLGAVWEIEPLEVKNQTFSAVLAEERARHPYLYHLDKIAKSD